jgi:histidinol-phosphate aminotransferase
MRQLQALKDKLRAAMGIPDNLSIMLGNGSDELIQIIAMALAGPERNFLAPEPGFVMYRLISQDSQCRIFCRPFKSR